MSRRINTSRARGTSVRKPSDGGAKSSTIDAYWARSTRPLHMLVFLAPLIAMYELGSIFFLTDTAAGVQRSVEAYKLFGQFFHLFGLAGVYLPGVALAAVLIIWHFMVKDRWTIQWRTIGGMFAESLAWTLPLLVLAAATDHTRSVWHAAARTIETPLATGLASPGGGIHDLPLMTRLTIAIGAGIYEEMLFRLVGLALLHFILVDLIATPPKVGMSISVLLAALAFSLYHRPDLPAEWPKFLFFTLSGVYLGAVYMMRGFGIVVGTHAMYDILVLVVFPTFQGGQNG